MEFTPDFHFSAKNTSRVELLIYSTLLETFSDQKSVRTILKIHEKKIMFEVHEFLKFMNLFQICKHCLKSTIFLNLQIFKTLWFFISQYFLKIVNIF